MNNRIDLHFLLLAIAMMIVGVGMGIYMGATQEFQYSPIHAHINLVGWASLALFGLTYRAYPELAERKLARWHLMLSGTSAVLFPIGIGLAILKGSELLVIAMAFVWLSGAIIFLLQILSLLGVRSRSAGAVPAE
jgi:hypothetical protein